MGVRPALIPILTSYLSNRQMQVRVNNTYSSTYRLPGGGPQGTLLGLISYFVQSNDSANSLETNKIFKFVDDLTVLELVIIIIIIILFAKLTSYIKNILYTTLSYRLTNVQRCCNSRINPRK